MTPILKRIVRAAMLDRRAYEEVEADPGALWPACGILAVSAMSTVAGMTGRFAWSDLLSGQLLGMLGWAVWSGIAWLVGARLVPEPQARADWGELLRTKGFASAPGILSLLGFIPVLAGIVPLAASIWTLLAFAVAVRQVLDYRSTARAIAVSLAGWLVYVGLLLMIPHASAGALLIAPGAQAHPAIVKLDPETGRPGDIITAYGTSLDSSAVEYIYLTDGSVTALINMLEQNVTSIRFRIPSMLTSGCYEVVIRSAGRYGRSIPQALTLTVE